MGGTTIMVIGSERGGPSGAVSSVGSGRDAFEVLDADHSSIQHSIMAHIEQLIGDGKIVTSSIDGFVVEHRIVSVPPAVRRQAEQARRTFA